MQVPSLYMSITTIQCIVEQKLLVLLRKSIHHKKIVSVILFEVLMKISTCITFPILNHARTLLQE